MLVQFQVWRAQRRARYLSKFSPRPVAAAVNGINVGFYRDGKETAER